MEYINLIKDKNFEIGVIESFQGEILTVNINKTNQYVLGDSLYCIYGGFRFDSKILKKNNNSISLYVPLSIKEFPKEKREFPRIPVKMDAYINSNMEENVYHTKPVLHADVVDISVMGFRFSTAKKLNVGPVPYYLYLETDIGKIETEVLLKHETVLNDKYQYGCEINNITNNHLNGLLRVVLKRQLELSVN